MSRWSLDALAERVRDPRAGAVVTFTGRHPRGRRLEYEAYREMAEPKIAEIVARAIERHGLTAAAAEHRIGTVPLSEPSVAVAVSAPHRDAAFAGAREIIDEIKARGPDLEEGGGRMGAGDGAAPGDLRALPAVHELAAALDAPHALAVAAARRTIDERRAALLEGDRRQRRPVARARELLAELERPSLRRVINATGVIVHTNLGRAPLAAAARDAVARAGDGYSTSSSTSPPASAAAATRTSRGCSAS